MARIKVNIKAAEKALRARFKRATKDKKLLTEIGETAVKNSVGETRLGMDPATGDTLAGFKDTKRYPDRRADIARRNGSGANFKPKKSNMTITGQLLKAIRYKIKNGNVILDVANTSRRKYGNEKSTPDNKTLAQWHKDGAGGYEKRNILGVSDKTSETIANLVRSFFRRNLNKR